MFERIVVEDIYDRLSNLFIKGISEYIEENPSLELVSAHEHIHFKLRVKGLRVQFKYDLGDNNHIDFHAMIFQGCIKKLFSKKSYISMNITCDPDSERRLTDEVLAQVDGLPADESLKWSDKEIVDSIYCQFEKMYKNALKEWLNTMNKMLGREPSF